MTREIPGDPIAAIFAALPRPELSAKTGFSGNRLNRHGDRRDDAAFLAAQEERARFVLFDGAALVEGDGAPHGLYHHARPADIDPETRVYCGEDADGPIYAYALRATEQTSDVGGLATTPPSQQPLRPFAERFAPLDAALGTLAEAASLTGWHVRHQFCAKCGGRTRNEQAGWRRRCEECGAMHFPRTDPVVIVNVVDPGTGDVLLGRQERFPEGMFSCLAGFVESGESLEDAVRREVLEETGVPLGTVTYKASQPWPFPSTMMMGFEAEALGREITLDEVELAEARWFSPAELRVMARNPREPGVLSLPPALAIARTLLDYYLSAR
ncbi:MAG: NAD(+) diphosphatase [Devosiaceae bacterium]|nr:NAD(+) diphosphatase [Devosiaceae bacterium MH13]